MPIPGPHKRWKYDLHPSVAMTRSVIAGMKQKTGRSLEEWAGHVKKHGPAGEKQRAAWLKTEHGLGTNYAGWIAQRSLGAGGANEDADEYLKLHKTTLRKCSPGPRSICAPSMTRS